MNIKELKDLIKNLDDNIPIAILTIDRYYDYAIFAYESIDGEEVERGNDGKIFIIAGN